MKKLIVILSTIFLLFGCTSNKSTSEDKVQDGDVVNIDFKGSYNGVAFDGGTATDYDLRIGSNSFIDDFEEQLIGMKVGETKTITVTFPDNYGVDSLAGKDAQFEVTINEINR